MIDYLSRTFEERFGIKTDPDDIKKLQKHIIETCGGNDPLLINKILMSQEALDFLTVNETYFFREPFHFYFLLDLLSSYEKEMASNSVLRICCAAVANGCEAYSIAMLIEAYNKGLFCGKTYPVKPVSYQIDAFDINPKVIENARRGIYTERAMREDGSCFHHITDPWLSKPQKAAVTDVYQVNSSLKKNINFFVHNLMDELLPKEYDLIFFRNAFIYFLPKYRERVLSNLISNLKEGGILITGVSETAGVHHKLIEGKNNNDVFYFQKKRCDAKLSAYIYGALPGGLTGIA